MFFALVDALATELPRNLVTSRLMTAPMSRRWYGTEMGVRDIRSLGRHRVSTNPLDRRSSRARRRLPVWKRIDLR